MVIGIQGHRAKTGAFRLLFCLLYGPEMLPSIVSICPLTPELPSVHRVNVRMTLLQRHLDLTKGRLQIMISYLELLGLISVFMKSGPVWTFDVHVPAYLRASNT